MATKLPTPVNVKIDPEKMELTFGFADAHKHGIKVFESASAEKIIVPETEIVAHPVNNEIKINLIGLPHEGLYLPGKYTLELKGVSIKKSADSEVFRTEFEMTSITAVLANSRLLMKTVAAHEDSIKKMNEEFGGKITLFPDLKKTIAEVENLVTESKNNLGELRELKLNELHTQVLGALNEIGTDKNERVETLRQLQAVLEEVRKIKAAETKSKDKTTPSATASTAHAKSTVGRGHDWFNGIVPILLIVAGFGLAVIVLVQHGLLTESKLLLQNGGSNAAIQPAAPQPQASRSKMEAPTPPVAPKQKQPEIQPKTTCNIKHPPVIFEQTTVNSSPDYNQKKCREVWFPITGREQNPHWSDMVYPGETAVYHIKKGWQVTPYFNENYVKEELIGFDPQLSGRNFNHDKGFTLSLRQPNGDAQKVEFDVVPKPMGH